MLLKKLFLSENRNDIEIENSSVEYLPNMYRTASNETTLVSEILNVINEKNTVITPAQLFFLSLKIL